MTNYIVVAKNVIDYAVPVRYELTYSATSTDDAINKAKADHPTWKILSARAA